MVFQFSGGGSKYCEEGIQDGRVCKRSRRDRHQGGPFETAGFGSTPSSPIRKVGGIKHSVEKAGEVKVALKGAGCRGAWTGKGGGGAKRGLLCKGWGGPTPFCGESSYIRTSWIKGKKSHNHRREGEDGGGEGQSAGGGRL